MAHSIIFGLLLLLSFPSCFPLSVSLSRHSHRVNVHRPAGPPPSPTDDTINTDLLTMDADQKAAWFKQQEAHAVYLKYKVTVPPPDSMPARSPSPSQQKLLLESDSEIQTQSSAFMGVYPPAGVVLSAVVPLPAGSMHGIQARRRIRAVAAGGLGPDDAAALPTMHNLYTLDAAGRVTSVDFLVGGGVGAGGAPRRRANQWCDVCWNSLRQGGDWFNEGDQHTRVRGEFQCGHIIGSALGGSDIDPLNFVPMHYLANNHGRWYRAEKIAYTLARFLESTPAGAYQVRVHITFAYHAGGGPAPPLSTAAAHPFVPVSGTYRISISQANFVAHVAPTLNSGDVEVFEMRSINVGAVAAPGSTRELTINWRNQPDIPVNVAPGGAGAAVPIGPAPGVVNAAYYVPDPSLFWP